MLTLKELSSLYEDTLDKNLMVYNYCEEIAKTNDQIYNHRLYIENNKLGFGDTAFNGMWKLIVDELDNNFKFLEIGVYKGQIITLIALLSKIQNKSCKVYGITPLSNVGDRFWEADISNYAQDIQTLIDMFELNDIDIIIKKALSTESHAIQFAEEYRDFDVIFIDGGHNYETVKSDILNYKEYVKIGGYLVMDDASKFLNIPSHINNGLPDVSEAVRDYLENDDRYINILNCGHDRIFKRVRDY